MGRPHQAKVGDISILGAGLKFKNLQWAPWWKWSPKKHVLSEFWENTLSSIGRLRVLHRMPNCLGICHNLCTHESMLCGLMEWIWELQDKQSQRPLSLPGLQPPLQKPCTNWISFMSIKFTSKLQSICGRFFPIVANSLASLLYLLRTWRAHWACCLRGSTPCREKLSNDNANAKKNMSSDKWHGWLWKRTVLKSMKNNICT